MRKTIFVILSRIPYPLEKGDKLRAFYQIRELSRHHELIICALSDEKPHILAHRELGKYSKNIYFFRLRRCGIIFSLGGAVFSGKPFQTAYFFSKRIRRNIISLIDKHKPDHIFCQLIRTAEYATGVNIDKTIDYQDVFSEGLRRRLEFAPWYLKPLLSAEFRRVKRYERTVFDLFDKKTIISYPDRDKIPHPGRDSITVIPNGVDTNFFRPENLDKEFDILFTGNMAYPPNVDGAEFLVKEIMPLVWRDFPETRVVIAGANPAPGVRALEGRNVIITGWVDDIREYYWRSRIFVAPMRIGTGLQNKVLEAMATRLPCITSPLANAALRAKDGKQVLIGSDKGEYAQHILSLLKDKDLGRYLGEEGYSFVLDGFNWKSTSGKLESVITG